MDTNLLRAFLALAEEKNFTNAAKKLHRSQSAVSLQIGRLEAILGKPLFVRTKRNVSLTHEAEKLLGYAQELLRVEESIVQMFRKPKLTGKVHFGTPEDIATTYLPGILSKFIETNPGVLLDVRCDLTINLQEGFREKCFDLVLIKQDPSAPHPQSEPIWKEPLVWVAKQEMRVCPAKMEEERAVPLVTAPAPCVYRQRGIDALNAQGIPWRLVYTSPSLAGAIAAVKAGLGVAVLPATMVQKGMQILHALPALKDAEIALLIQSQASKVVKVLASYIKEHILLG
jgi:DNA-binding transcriptional LysR family regulator